MLFIKSAFSDRNAVLADPDGMVYFYCVEKFPGSLKEITDAIVSSKKMRLKPKPELKQEADTGADGDREDGLGMSLTADEYMVQSIVERPPPRPSKAGEKKTLQPVKTESPMPSTAAGGAGWLIGFAW